MPSRMRKLRNKTGSCSQNYSGIDRSKFRHQSLLPVVASGSERSGTKIGGINRFCDNSERITRDRCTDMGH